MAEWAATIQTLLLVVLVLGVLTLFRSQLTALLRRPNVSVEVAGFKISAGGRDRVVEKMVEAQSAKGDAPDKATAQGEVNHLADAAEDLGRPARVLWVDDEPSNNLLEYAALDRVHAAVDLAIDNDQAEFKIKLFGPYDLIVTDMRETDGRLLGHELLARLRDSGDQTPLIFYTTYRRERFEEYFDDAVAHGAQGCASEPFALFELVARALRLSGATRYPSRRRSRRAWRKWQSSGPVQATINGR